MILNPGLRGRTAEQKLLDKCMPEPNSGCWLWLGYVNACGYGVTGFRGKTSLAHRVSYTIFCKEIPDDLNVLHRCDNPPCVNPEHLFPGTQVENIYDMENKGRALHYKGQQHGRAVLTEANVKVIRDDPRSGTILGKIYNVDRHTITAVKRRDTWKHVA